MANDPHGTPAPAGSMDITDHMKTYLAFWKATKWSAGVLIVIAVLLAVFRTHNGM
jgi:hypothetical protein